MAHVAEELVLIGHQLRFALFGLECALGVTFNTIECERIFREETEDQVSTKQYSLFESRGLIVSGHVFEYEPETILLRLEGRSGVADLLRRVIEGSKFHALRLLQSQELST